VPTWVKGKTEKQAVKEWQNILDKMIYTFETNLKIIDDELTYIPTWDKEKTKKRRICTKISKELNKKYPDIPCRTMTERECQKYEKGFQLYQKWFFHLWD
jgi:molecular chaperone DnaK (HSP70)